MPILLVTYDLNQETKRPNITKKLKEGYPTWAKLSESSYAIETTNSPEQVYGFLKPLLDDNDALLVITLKLPYWGQGPKDVIDWLDKKLTY